MLMDLELRSLIGSQKRDSKGHSEHRVAQEAGKKVWYAQYVVCVTKVERACGMILT